MNFNVNVFLYVIKIFKKDCSLINSKKKLIDLNITNNKSNFINNFVN